MRPAKTKSSSHFGAVGPRQKIILKTEPLSPVERAEHTMDLWGDFLLSITNLLSPVGSMPWSAVFILVVSVSLAVISIWATNRFTDIEKMKEQMEEIKVWRSKFDQARKSMDPLLLQEVADEQARIMRLNSQIMSARCKPMCIYYIPFLIIFAVLAALYSSQVVAIIPFNAQEWLFFIDGWIGENVVGSGFGLY
ncbi:MAG: DUF106 domain-containing protein, partial [Candidatus Thorarchaeota archaeon]|nr:DUF106 domain-containing protein [Candidatus Thorarchaeota archaeon]